MKSSTAPQRRTQPDPRNDEPIQTQAVGPQKEKKKRRNQKDAVGRSIDILTVPDLLHVGLVYVHFGKERQVGVKKEVNIDRFLAHYGVPPTALVPFFNDLKDRFQDISYKEALMTMNWFKEYRTEHAMSGTWGFGCTKYIRNTLKEYAEKMASLVDIKIVFGGFDEKEMIVFSVDSVHFTANEFRLDPSAKWFDFKSHSSGKHSCSIFFLYS